MMPSHHIRSALMTGRAREERRGWDEERARTKSVALPPLQDAGVVREEYTAAPGDEFAAFEDLTDKLLRVPKSELDERLKESGSN